MDFRGTYKGGGGPDKTILNSAYLHDKIKVDVLVVYIKQPDDHEFQIRSKAEQLGLKYTDLADRSVFDLKCLWELRRLVKENRIQVLHTHDDKTLLYGVALRFLVPSLRLLHTCHSHEEYGKTTFSGRLAWYRFRLRKRVLGRLMKCHHKPVLAVSEDTRQRLVRSRLDPGNVEVLANGIDLEAWNRNGAQPALRHEFGLRSDQQLVGTVARITYDKDLPTFFAVAESVNRQKPGTVFVIVGDGYGDELAMAREEIHRRGLEKIVRLTGHRTDLKHIYASLDLFLMTSLTEGMPNTVLEAMAMELPVVSTNVGGLPELVENNACGLLLPVGDVDALSRAVTDLLTNSSRRKNFGHAARKRVEEKFNFRHRVRKMEDYYHIIALR